MFWHQEHYKNIHCAKNTTLKKKHYMNMFFTFLHKFKTIKLVKKCLGDLLGYIDQPQAIKKSCKNEVKKMKNFINSFSQYT